MFLTESSIAGLAPIAGSSNMQSKPELKPMLIPHISTYKKSEPKSVSLKDEDLVKENDDCCDDDMSEFLDDDTNFEEMDDDE